ncbi:DNA cytosine methyltransferase [Ktedonobacter robiniae]|uniref:DNA (cytosine-5-)-methyltransferase n=1 Tax=Ktedonobacter robiniae TaxID=2778365 RepID=A0ABQ3UV38_9CHLR|nr:DNA cytosine methyltransferase [Ktedonobacter robiniae]GHO56714.1 DNA cytosine methyltransferase [Ktedonobacter robiniae]
MTLDITATDMFCGAGGSTTGAVAAGATVKLAINHWSRAIETHNTNYPQTLHALTDLHKASPRRFPSTTILMASPECTSHSLAKGRKRKKQQDALPGMNEPDLESEAEERSRCTMWTPLDWAEYHDYQAIILENVVDAHLWRPFQSWLHAWRSLDYEYQLVYLNSMHAHPTPQSRDRMYFVAWKRGNRKPDLKVTPAAYCRPCGTDIDAIQSWKNPGKRYGKYKQQYVYRCPRCAREVVPYYYAAANAIEWSLPAPRIGDRLKPLREKTLQRIAYGLEKFAGNPFSIPMTRVQDWLRDMTREPFPTQTATETQGLVTPPFLLNLNHPEVRPVAIADQPFPTQTAYDSSGLTVPPFILDHLGEYRPREMTRPFSTICAAGNHQSLIVPPARSWLMTYYNNGQLVPLQEAAPTVTTLARHALVTSHSSAEKIAVEDCGFRMLAPQEIQAAMAFPKGYILTGTRREQVKMLGNAVTPPIMKLLMERVITSLE